MSPTIDPSKTQVKMSLAMLVVCLTTVGTVAGVYFNMREAVAAAQAKSDNNAAAITLLNAKIDNIASQLTTVQNGVARIEGAMGITKHKPDQLSLDDIRAQLENVKLTLNPKDE